MGASSTGEARKNGYGWAATIYEAIPHEFKATVSYSGLTATASQQVDIQSYGTYGEFKTQMGTLQHNEFWSGDITLKGDVTVPAGVSLTIDPSANISFEAIDQLRGGDDKDVIEIIVAGENADAVMADLSAMVEDGFGEP